MSNQSKLRFSVNGKEVLVISPAKLLESYFWGNQFNHIPYIVAFPHGDQISCQLELRGYSLKSIEEIRPIRPELNQTPEQITKDLITRLKGVKPC